MRCQRIAVAGRIVRVIIFSVLVGLIVHLPVAASAQQALGGPAAGVQTDTPEQRSKLTDAAIIAIVIAASVAAYKAMRKPCACPSDTMSSGALCGNRSAWAKPGGAKPLCFPADVTPAIIQAWRATKAVPGLF